MLALGIDPGTLHLGWGLVSRDGVRLRAVAYGVLNMKGDQPLATRLVAIADCVSELIETHRPDVASIETMFFHKDAQAAAKLGQARGVVLLCAERARVSIAEHAPARVKRVVVGNGRAEKPQISQMVRAVLSLATPPPSDAADALALAITELRVGRLGHPLMEVHRGTRRRVEAQIRARLAARGL